MAEWARCSRKAPAGLHHSHSQQRRKQVHTTTQHAACDSSSSRSRQQQRTSVAVAAALLRDVVMFWNAAYARGVFTRMLACKQRQVRRVRGQAAWACWGQAAWASC